MIKMQLFSANADAARVNFPGEIEETVKNADGTFNVTASLNIEADAKYDDAVFSCSAFITNDDMEIPSSFGDPISVLREFKSNIFLLCSTGQKYIVLPNLKKFLSDWLVVTMWVRS